MKGIKVQICSGTHCLMMGAMDIMNAVHEIEGGIEKAAIEVEVVKCFNCGQIQNAPVVVVNGRRLNAATPEKVMAAIMAEVDP